MADGESTFMKCASCGAVYSTTATICDACGYCMVCGTVGSAPGACGVCGATPRKDIPPPTMHGYRLLRSFGGADDREVFLAERHGDYFCLTRYPRDRWKDPAALLARFRDARDILGQMGFLAASLPEIHDGPDPCTATPLPADTLPLPDYVARHPLSPVAKIRLAATILGMTAALWDYGIILGEARPDTFWVGPETAAGCTGLRPTGLEWCARQQSIDAAALDAALKAVLRTLIQLVTDFRISPPSGTAMHTWFASCRKEPFFERSPGLADAIGHLLAAPPSQTGLDSLWRELVGLVPIPPQPIRITAAGRSVNLSTDTPLDRTFFETHFPECTDNEGYPIATYCNRDNTPLAVLQKREDGWWIVPDDKANNRLLLDGRELASARPLQPATLGIFRRATRGPAALPPLCITTATTAPAPESRNRCRLCGEPVPPGGDRPPCGAPAGLRSTATADAPATDLVLLHGGTALLTLSSNRAQDDPLRLNRSTMLEHPFRELQNPFNHAIYQYFPRNDVPLLTIAHDAGRGWTAAGRRDHRNWFCLDGSRLDDGEVPLPPRGTLSFHAAAHGDATLFTLTFEIRS